MLYSQDTIVAFATPASSGAVALLRVSGGQSLSILQTLTKRTNLLPRQAHFVKVYDGDNVLDTALALYFKAPKSYTGEDSFELSIHASPYIKSRLLEIVCSLGARIAKPGEYTQRAFLSGKMDLAQAQGVADIIASKNKSAHSAAMNILGGRLSQEFKQIRQTLADLLAQIEVRIDDVDDEMQPLSQKEVATYLNPITNKVHNLAETFSSGRLIKDGIKVALCGLSNAGKSSLLNKLLGYNRAIVSAKCGTTRDTLEAPLMVKGYQLMLVDTAGIRSTSDDEAEIEGMERSKMAVKSADIVIFLRDLTLQNKQEEDNFYSEVCSLNKQVLEVFNKIDKVENTTNKMLVISAKTGEGIEELKSAIIDKLQLNAVQENDLLITSASHYNSLKKAEGELKLALVKLADLELSAEHLRTALLALKELIGEVTTEDILDIVFSKFCVGK